MIRIITIGVFVFIVFSLGVSADIIKLDDGSFIEGKIVDVTEKKYVIQEKGGGKCTLSKESVVSVQKKTVAKEDLYNISDLYAQKLEKLITDNADSQMALAQWCFKNGLFEYAKRHYLAAAALDISLKSEIDDKLEIIKSLKIEEVNADIQGLIENGQYLLAENLIIDTIKRYPKADGTKVTEDQLIKLWGNKKAKELLENAFEGKDALPSVAPNVRNLGGIINYLESNDLSIEEYFIKCLKKGDDFAERAEEIRRDRIKEYYIDKALYCYYLVAYGAEKDSKVYKLALAKAKRLCDKYNIDNYKETFLSNLRR
jgi:hypothetical protein